MDVVKTLISTFIPESVEDQNSIITTWKLALGTTVGLTLIIGAFLILANVFQMVQESFPGFSVSNATIFVLVGVTVVWFTVTKIGVKSKANPQGNNNKTN